MKQCLPIYKEMHPISLKNNFIKQENNDTKHSPHIKNFNRIKTGLLDRPGQSPHLNTGKHIFLYIYKPYLELPQNKQQLKKAAAQAWKVS